MERRVLSWQNSKREGEKYMWERRVFYLVFNLPIS